MGTVTEFTAPWFKCNGCGKCCIELGGTLSASAEDIGMWRRAGALGRRILATAHLFHSNPQDRRSTVIAADLWFNPRTGNELSRCPWLRKSRSAKRIAERGAYYCGIYKLRPGVCREWPYERARAEYLGCEGIVK